MSKSYYILKMIKNKQKRISDTKKSVWKHLQISAEDNNNKCRICLSQGFNPIYSDRYTFDLPDAIQTISGLEISIDDMFPKKLCDDCYSLLKGAIIFRNSARESDEILRHTSTLLPITNTTDANVDDLTQLSDDNLVDNNFETPKELAGNPFKCKICKLEFTTLQTYSAHRTSKKHKNVRIQCKICQKLLTPQLYEKHLARHQSVSQLVCEFCGKLYRKDNLLRHLQLHSNELPFQCQICSYRGRFMESLKIHMRTHSGDKPFSCDKCEQRFITRSNLNRHLLTHVKEKPYKCVECNRGFYSQRDLDIHLKCDHIGIKEFSCRLCGNKYGMKKALMRHELRVHKRDKMAKGRMPLYLQAEFQQSNQLLAL